jgi:hypothetical protein
VRRARSKKIVIGLADCGDDDEDYDDDEDGGEDVHRAFGRFVVSMGALGVRPASGCVPRLVG